MLSRDVQFYDYLQCHQSNPAGAGLTFSGAGDNRVEVYLDNVFLFGQGDPSGGLQTGWAAMSAVQTVNGLTGASHTLQLRVINARSCTGGILVGQVSDVPEPGTAGLAATALGAFAISRRRATRSGTILGSVARGMDR